MRLQERLIRYRWTILIAVAAVTLAAAAIVPCIRFDFTPQAVFAGNDGLVACCEEFKKTFGYEDTRLMVLLEATGDRDVLDREALSWQARVASDLASLPRVKVQSIPTLEVPRLRLWRPWLVPARLVERLPVDEATEANVRASLAEFKLMDEALVSTDRRTAVILVSLDPKAREIDAVRSSVEAVDARLKARPPPEGYRYHLAGLPVLRADIVKNLQADLTFLLPAAGVCLLGALAVSFRRLSGTLVPLLAVATGLTWTLAVLVVFDRPLSIISSSLPVLLLIIGMSNCVHVVGHYAERCEKLGGRRAEAVGQTVKYMAFACLLTFLTTAIGFVSLVVARCDVLTALGWQAAMGLGFLYVSTILVTAALLPLFAPPRHGGFSGGPFGGKSTIRQPRPTANPQGLTDGRASPTTRFVAAAGYLVARHPACTLCASAALVVAALWFARDVVVDSRMMETYDEDHPTSRIMRLIEDRLGGYMALEVGLVADRPGRFTEPDVYRRVADAERFAAGQEEVLFSRSYVDLHQEVYARLRRRQELREVLPPGDDELRRQVRLSTKILRPVAGILHYAEFMTREGTRARILLRVRDLGTRRTLALVDHLEARFAELFPPGCGISVGITGDAYVLAKALDSFIRDLLYSLLAASVVIFTLIAVLFRSLRTGLITIIPNLTPLVLTLGYMGLRGYELNMANVIVFAISLGVAVDGTIHFLSRLRYEEKRGHRGIQAIHRTLYGAGRAIALANLLIVCGLAVLLFSDFVPTRRFAELTSVTMIGALVGDLLLLPACLMLFRKHAKPVAPAESRRREPMTDERAIDESGPRQAA
jgi:predicted RND superfamily exporter protein